MKQRRHSPEQAIRKLAEGEKFDAARELWTPLMPGRIRSDKIGNLHVARVSNGPTEALNNLIKRVGFGFRKFANYRIRVLLYAGKPNWRVPGSIVVR